MKSCSTLISARIPQTFFPCTTMSLGHLMPAVFYETLPSTNLQAKLDAENGAGEGTLIVADTQTAGRGRRGRSWSSPGGKNVYFTKVPLCFTRWVPV